MKMDDIRIIARNAGIKPGKLNKTQLVRSIQLTEGNFDCFATATNGECDQWACIWREDCFTTSIKKLAKKTKATTKKKATDKKKPTHKKKTVAKKKSKSKK